MCKHWYMSWIITVTVGSVSRTDKFQDANSMGTYNYFLFQLENCVSVCTQRKHGCFFDVIL